jgi:hypothetical protein
MSHTKHYHPAVEWRLKVCVMSLDNHASCVGNPKIILVRCINISLEMPCCQITCSSMPDHDQIEAQFGKHAPSCSQDKRYHVAATYSRALAGTGTPQFVYVALCLVKQKEEMENQKEVKVDSGLTVESIDLSKILPASAFEWLTGWLNTLKANLKHITTMIDVLPYQPTSVHVGSSGGCVFFCSR